MIRGDSSLVFLGSLFDIDVILLHLAKKLLYGIKSLLNQADHE